MFCFQIKVFGIVQGVFFRHSAKQEAEKLGLVGYAKNLPDGAVEIVVCLPAGDGNENKIKEFINWCYQGPDLAKVEKAKATEISFQKFSNFQIL